MRIYTFSSNVEYRATGSSPLTVVIISDSEEHAWDWLLTADRQPFNERRWWDVEESSMQDEGIIAEVTHD